LRSEHQARLRRHHHHRHRRPHRRRPHHHRRHQEESRRMRGHRSSRTQWLARPAASACGPTLTATPANTTATGPSALAARQSAGDAQTITASTAVAATAAAATSLTRRHSGLSTRAFGRHAMSDYSAKAGRRQTLTDASHGQIEGSPSAMAAGRHLRRKPRAHQDRRKQGPHRGSSPRRAQRPADRRCHHHHRRRRPHRRRPA
jgi:hypothetical protein